jgi:hypothetical protein
MERGIASTKKYLGIQPLAKESMTAVPVVLLTRLRLIALILRLSGVYLLFCVFWIGWHFALELIGDLEIDYDLMILQDGVYSTLMLAFLLAGMAALLLAIVIAYGKALRPLRKSASRYPIHNLERILKT